MASDHLVATHQGCLALQKQSLQAVTFVENLVVVKPFQEIPPKESNGLSQIGQDCSTSLLFENLGIDLNVGLGIELHHMSLATDKCAIWQAAANVPESSGERLSGFGPRPVSSNLLPTREEFAHECLVRRPLHPSFLPVASRSHPVISDNSFSPLR